MLTPSLKVLIALAGIFTFGMVVLGLVVLVAIGGIGYLAVTLAMLIVHVLSTAIYSSLFTFALSILLSAFLGVLLVVFSIRVFAPLVARKSAGVA
jgi:hypothetical protein